MRTAILINPVQGEGVRPGGSLGLGYVAASLESVGVETQQVDDDGLEAPSNAAIRACIDADTDLVGIGALFTQQLDRVIELATGLRDAGYDGRIIVGGHGTSFVWERLLLDCSAIDAIAMFEADESIVDYVASQGRPDSPGFTTRGMDGVQRNATLDPPTHLDGLPLPIRRPEDLAEGHASLVSSRGCAAHCSFCESGNYGNRYHSGPKWRSRSAGDVTREIGLLASVGVVNISFVDDDFLGGAGQGRDRALEFAARLVGDGLRVNYAIECRADELDQPLVDGLARSGLRHVFMGLESGNTTDIALYGKRTPLPVMLDAVRVLRQAGVSVETGFIMFHPGSSLEGVRANLEFLRRTETATYSQVVNRLQVYPGSPLHTHFQRNGFIFRRKGYGFDYTIADRDVERFRLRLREVLEPVRKTEDRLLRRRYTAETEGSTELERLRDSERRFAVLLCDLAMRVLDVRDGDSPAPIDELIDELSEVASA